MYKNHFSKLYSTVFIISISSNDDSDCLDFESNWFYLVICHISYSSSENLSTSSWLNSMQDLALKVKENPIVESNPINEGFMMLSDSTKKIRPKPLPCNSSSPTCKTIIRIQRITTRTTTMKSSTALIDHSIGHLGRRLLNEPSYDPESETMLTDDEIKQLSKQLFNFEMTVDGSGFSMLFRKNNFGFF